MLKDNPQLTAIYPGIEDEELAGGADIEPAGVTIPAGYVTAVVVSPRGAHPTAMFGRYNYDRSHLELYARSVGAGEEPAWAYLERWVLGMPEHLSYLAAGGVS